MPKGVPNKRYTPEFKKLVIETMQEEKMLPVDEVDSKAFLTNLFEAVYDELPSPKRKNNGIGGITDELYSDHKRKY